MCVKDVLSKFISNFQVHVGAAIASFQGSHRLANYSVVPWGGGAFNATQFSRKELLTNIANI